MLKLDLIQTVAFAGVVLFMGYGLRRWIKPLDRFNLPAPVIGGLLISLFTLFCHHYQITPFQFDTTLRDPLMIAFFTSVGFAASLSLLKVGGPQVLIFFLLATIVVVLQNVLGILLAWPFGLHPLLGVICGSVTQTGGPATALAFGPVFEQAGVQAATTAGVAAAIFGIISGGLLGGPVGTFLIEKNSLKRARAKAGEVSETRAEEIVEKLLEKKEQALKDEERSDFILLKNVVIILVAMWIGSWVSKGFASLGITLPAYIGAMLVAAIIRNFDDYTGWLGLDQKVIDNLGHVALNLFLVIALMTLRLWELAGLFLPMLIILLAQVVLVAVVAFFFVFKFMGRDYEAAVMSAGYCGFALGTTANAMANMKALVERYGRAPRAFLVVPLVGAFFIDFTNALVITVFLNLFK